MLTPQEIDELVSLTVADLKALTPEEYLAMSDEARRQVLAGEPTDYEKILKAKETASRPPFLEIYADAEFTYLKPQ